MFTVRGGIVSLIFALLAGCSEAQPGSSATDIWAIGSYGVTSHYTEVPPGATPSWTVTYNGTSSFHGGTLRRIFGLDGTHIWAVGDDGTVLRYRP